MKTDFEYLGKLLNIALESDKSSITTDDFKSNGIQITDENGFCGLDDKFLHHIQIASDNLLFSDLNGYTSHLKTYGINLGVNGHVSIRTPFRLTQKGHDFAGALANTEILKVITTKLKDAPVDFVISTGKDLLSKYLNKLLES